MSCSISCNIDCKHIKSSHSAVSHFHLRGKTRVLRGSTTILCTESSTVSSPHGGTPNPFALCSALGAVSQTAASCALPSPWSTCGGRGCKIPPAVVINTKATTTKKMSHRQCCAVTSDRGYGDVAAFFLKSQCG